MATTPTIAPQDPSRVVDPPRSLLYRLAQLPSEARGEILATLPDDLVTAIVNDWHFIARPDQIPPDNHTLIWALLGGRGAGKSRTMCEWAHERMIEHYTREERSGLGHTKHRIAAASRSSADARDTLIEGESGLLAVAERRGITVKYEPSKRRVDWPDLNCWATIYTAEEPDQARGPQHHTAICDEYAAWDHTKTDDLGNTLFSNLLLGLRLGHDPKIAIGTTPKRIPEVKELQRRGLDKEDDSVVITGASTYANAANLAPSFITEVVNKYKGTSLYDQEILGIVMLDDDSSLWTEETMVLAHRFRHIDPLPDDFPTIVKIVVAVDPPKMLNKDECGIVAVGLYDKPLPGLGTRCAAVLADESLRGSPEKWAKTAVDLAYRLNTRTIIAESNQGGEMVRSTIRNADKAGSLDIQLVNAVHAKRLRAEPVAQLYEQQRIIHLDTFTDLEDQMVSWLPESTTMHDDRIDALVHGITHLIPDLNSRPSVVGNPATTGITRGRPDPTTQSRSQLAARIQRPNNYRAPQPRR